MESLDPKSWIRKSPSQCEYDAIVIGAGHNGLVAAAYLARAGLSVLVTERRSKVGGACESQVLPGGYRINPGANWFGMLQSRIIRDLNLGAFGLRGILTHPQCLSLSTAHGHLLVDDLIYGRESKLAVQTKCAGAPKFHEECEQMRCALRELLLDSQDFESACRILKGTVFENGLERLLNESIVEYLSRFFDDDALIAALSLSPVALHNCPPDSSGGILWLFFMMLAEVGGSPGWGFARGGMGTVSEAILSAAMSHHAEVVIGVEAEQILTRNNHVHAVLLSNGSCLRCRFVISSVAPSVLLQICPDATVATIARKRLSTGSGTGTSVSLVLSEIPKLSISGYKLSHPLAGICQIAPSVRYISDAWAAARDGRPLSRPVITFSMPTLVDETLAPNGRQILTAFVQFTPSQSYTESEILGYTIGALDDHVPGLRGLVEDAVAYGPPSIEERYLIPNGHPEHVQMDSMRFIKNINALGFVGARTNIIGLYLGGASAGVGGTVTGAPGYRSARECLAEWTRLKS